MQLNLENGAARDHALSIIKDEKATQHQKLDAILWLMLRDHDRIVSMEAAFRTHPFSWIPPQHRGKLWTVVGVWSIAVTVALGEKIWLWLEKFGVF